MRKLILAVLALVILASSVSQALAGGGFFLGLAIFRDRNDHNNCVSQCQPAAICQPYSCVRPAYVTYQQPDYWVRTRPAPVIVQPPDYWVRTRPAPVAYQPPDYWTKVRPAPVAVQQNPCNFWNPQWHNRQYGQPCQRCGHAVSQCRCVHTMSRY